MCIKHCRFVQPSTVFVNLNLVSKVKVDCSVSVHVQAIPCKFHSDNGPEIQCRMSMADSMQSGLRNEISDTCLYLI